MFRSSTTTTAPGKPLTSFTTPRSLATEELLWNLAQASRKKEKAGKEDPVLIASVTTVTSSVIGKQIDSGEVHRREHDLRRETENEKDAKGEKTHSNTNVTISKHYFSLS